MAGTSHTAARSTSSPPNAAGRPPAICGPVRTSSVNLEESLRRLKTDYVDIMQLHGASVEQCEHEGLVESLQMMRKEGKVRWIGASTNLPHLPTFLEWDAFDVYQLPYSALDRDHEGWLTRAAQAGAGIVIRGGAALGQPGVGSGSEARWGKFEEAGLDDLLTEGETRTAFVVAVYAHPSGHPLQYRRDDEPGPPAGEHPGSPPRRATGRRLQRGETSARGDWSHAWGVGRLTKRLAIPLASAPAWYAARPARPGAPGPDGTRYYRSC